MVDSPRIFSVGGGCSLESHRACTFICCMRYVHGLWHWLNPNNAQAGLVSVVVGAGAAWFGLYVNSTSTKHDAPSSSTQQQEQCPNWKYYNK